MLKRLTTTSLFLILVLVLFVAILGVDDAFAAPNPPNSFTVSNVTSTSFKTTWSGGPGFGWHVVFYNFRYRKKGNTDWTAILQSGTSYYANIVSNYITLPNLTAATTYEYQVRTMADTFISLDTMSDWSSTQTAKTNSPPTTQYSMADRTFIIGDPAITEDVSYYFTDPDGDTLTYTENSDLTSLEEAVLTITPSSTPTTATVTVTASDADSSATQSFKVTVKANQAPQTVGTIPDQTVTAHGANVYVSMSSRFSDPEDQLLTLSATSSDTSKATVNVSGAEVGITGLAAGSVTITVTATDTYNATGTQTFSVTVEPNSAPVKVGTIPTQTVSVTGSAATVDVSDYFSDAELNPLTYSATSSNTNKVTVSVSGSTLTITPVATGSATITVNATDISNGAATQTFTARVISNRSPVKVGTIPTQSVRVGGSTTTVDVSSYFSDPDGNPLTYSATSSNTNKATASMSGSTVVISAVAAGTATIRVKARDTYNASTTQSFSVKVVASDALSSVGSIPTQTVAANKATGTVEVSSYFSGPTGVTLTYSATSSSPSKATVSISGSTVTITGVNTGWSTIKVTATGTDNATATQSFSARVVSNLSPTAVGTIPTKSVVNSGTDQFSISSYFSDPDGDTLTYTASSSDTAIAEANVGTGTNNTTLYILANGLGTATITVTAADSSNATATQTFSAKVVTQTADALPGLSTTEQLLLGQLLTYDTIIFNELHNGSDDANDWLELRNVSNIDIPLDNWQFTIQTGSGTAIIPFAIGAVIPAGEVLLIRNTEGTTSSVVAETFALPQTDFALILRSPTAFGDIAGNYFQTEKERPETAPELTADTVWERVEATTSGYRAEAWAVSTHRNGLGSPGYQPSAVTGDLNNDGIVNILDLVLVASQFGTTGLSAADLNGDNTVNIQDLVLVANVLNNAATAPSVKQPTAAMVNTWVQLAQQNAPDTIGTSLPDGFSYTRGIQVLQQLARALTPDTTALLANYPNPFNPETWIPYQLAKAADVTVTIYASDGNVVRTLALGYQAAGMYKNRSQAAYWDGKNELGESVASGVYFYTLSTESTRDSVTAGDFTATRKMLILK